MIVLAIVAWVLLTLCGEYVLRQASFAEGWRTRRTRGFRGLLWSKMLACFHCPFGWSGWISGLIVLVGAALWTVEPWAVAPLLFVFCPFLGLGLARGFYWLTPVACDRPDPRSSEG